ncbi:hypothetical protein ACGFIR_24790 [Micromonospora sp. NPDC049051]|uniref:hypothetical protein n=1 Tax=Micromonospora sp. NPDC049051 TaxID=3364264 RepID=UPI0037217AF9
MEQPARPTGEPLFGRHLGIDEPARVDDRLVHRPGEGHSGEWQQPFRLKDDAHSREMFLGCLEVVDGGSVNPPSEPEQVMLLVVLVDVIKVGMCRSVRRRIVDELVPSSQQSSDVPDLVCENARGQNSAVGLHAERLNEPRQRLDRGQPFSGIESCRSHEMQSPGH